MANLIIKKCTDNETDFINEFASDIRQADYNELTSLVGNDIKKELAESIANSMYSYKAMNEKNKPIALYGITKVQGVNGYLIWCVGTNEFKNYEKTFVKLSRQIIKIWLKKYKLLYNFVSIKNRASRKWLEWLGAEFEHPFTAGIKNEKFIYFILKGE